MKSSKMIKSFRGKVLKTQIDVAKELSISRQQYNNYENNPLQCNLEILFKIFNILDVDSVQINEFLNALKQDYLSYSGVKEE